MAFKIQIRHVQEIAESRKMLISEVLEGIEHDCDNLRIVDGDQVRALARKLLVTPARLLGEQDDLDDGVKLCRRDGGFVRRQERKGKLYYTYRHLATTSAAPELMALRVSVHCNDEEDVVLNGGHESKELVYVTIGQIRMHWANGAALRSIDLDEGDSVYLSPNIPHSFRSLIGESELLAFNYCLPM